ncbi:MAG TPA: hypothetical protein V6C52_11830 [Coleofasciculaceae cyanobacterium]|jgi:hypothetical protein
MSLITQTAAKAALSRPTAFRQLARNTAEILYNKGQSVFHNHAALRKDALVVASLAQVASRIFISNVSAYKAKNTQDGPYRYWQAMNTTLREFLGWILSFGVLRFTEEKIRQWFRRGFGIETPPEPPSMLKQWRQALGKAWRREWHEIPKPAPDPALVEKFTFKNTARFEKLRPWLEKIPLLKGKAPAEMVQHLVHWAPFLLSAIPTILLSGYILERFTRDHADSVVNLLSHRRKNKENQEQTPPENAFSKSFSSGSCLRKGFNSFCSDIQSQRMVRNFGPAQTAGASSPWMQQPSP